jgi:hypothetical protein
MLENKSSESRLHCETSRDRPPLASLKVTENVGKATAARRPYLRWRQKEAEGKTG